MSSLHSRPTPTTHSTVGSDDTALESGHPNSAVGGSAVTVAQLQDVLSPAAFGQLERLRDVDFCRVDYKFLEIEFADALRELEHVESVTAALFRAVLEMKRTQALHSNRMVELEDEIQDLQTSLKSLAQPTKMFNTQAEGQLRKERKELAEFKTYVAERMDTMQTSLGKAERNVDVLQSRCSTNKDTIDKVVMELFPMKELANFFASQFSEMQEWDDVIWRLVIRLQEHIHDLALEVDHERSANEVAYQGGTHGMSLEAEIQREEVASRPSSLRPLILDHESWYRSQQGVEGDGEQGGEGDGELRPGMTRLQECVPEDASFPAHLDGSSPSPAPTDEGVAPPAASSEDSGSRPRSPALASSSPSPAHTDEGVTPPAASSEDSGSRPRSPALASSSPHLGVGERILAILSIIGIARAGSQTPAAPPILPPPIRQSALVDQPNLKDVARKDTPPTMLYYLNLYSTMYGWAVVCCIWSLLSLRWRVDVGSKATPSTSCEYPMWEWASRRA